MNDESSPAAPRPVVVLVTGSGRSGTSSLAGSLKRLGLHVPQPEVPPKPTNPTGFYEPRWVVEFHKRHLDPLVLSNIDTRPSAVSELREMLSDGRAGDELAAWLSPLLSHRQLVVKDPHAYWFADLWAEVTSRLGADVRLLTSLRHPAEVVGSRDLAYLQDVTEDLRRIKETSHVAGWIHAALLTEAASRGGHRAFVPYHDLLADWRGALDRVGAQLDIRYDADLSSSSPHPIDEFIDGSMRHSALTWADIGAPRWLTDMAEDVWQSLLALVAEPGNVEIQRRLDEIHRTYRQRYDEAIALTYDHARAQRVTAVRRAKAKQRARVKALKRRLEAAQREDGQRDTGGSGGRRPWRRRAVRRRSR